MGIVEQCAAAASPADASHEFSRHVPRQGLRSGPRFSAARRDRPPQPSFNLLPPFHALCYNPCHRQQHEARSPRASSIDLPVLPTPSSRATVLLNCRPCDGLRVRIVYPQKLPAYIRTSQSRRAHKLPSKPLIATKRRKHASQVAYHQGQLFVTFTFHC